MARKTKKKATKRAAKAPGRRASAKSSGKPRRKRKPRRAKTPSEVKWLAAALILVLISGVVSVKLLRTTWGKALLLDTGFTSYYSEVQETIDSGMRQAMEDAGVGRFNERVVSQVVRGEQVLVREWETLCDPPCRFVEINLALTRAVRKTGAVVRSGSELRDGPTAEPHGLFIEAGSRRYPTHRLTIVHRGSSESPQPSSTAIPTPSTRPRLALVIDDLGYAKSELIESFMAIDLPLTFAVIPSLPHTRYAIARVQEKGKQAILHMPMEAEDHAGETPMVLTTMSGREISALVERYLRENPGVIGVNNHMGSRATQDEQAMGAVIPVIKAHGLFFLDSLTSPKSIAYNTAKTLGVPTARNDLFLDADTEDYLVVEERLLRLLDIAKRRGTAIGIGHPKQWTYLAITRNIDVLKESGVEFVFVSELVQ